jgi:hypothetical protein
VKRANELVDVLLSQNPEVIARDLKTYRNTLLAILAHYPLPLVMVALHPVEGLVANSKYQIKPSDLKGFLDKLIEDQNLAKHRAEQMLKEQQRRAKLAEEAERYGPRKTQEERAALVASLLRVKAV